MHSFLHFRRAGGSHISTLFYTCNMRKRENKAFFLRISGEMAKKRRNMQPTAKRNGSMQGFAPRKHPRQACSLDCIAKLRFAFQPALQAYSYANIPHQPASSPPAPAGNNLSSSSFFFTANLSLPSANNHPSGVSRPALTRRPSFHIGTLTAFLHPTHSNSRQVSPAGCQYPSLFTSFLLIFCKYFSFFKKRRNFLRRKLLYCLFFSISKIDFVEYRIYEFLA